jgi:cysteine desulfurase/selenocysteine lyase
MIDTVTEDGVTYGAPPHRFEAGTPPIAQAAGLGAALDYINSIGKAAIAAHETRLRDYAMERLGALNSIEIFGRAPDKGAIVSFALKGAHAHDVATILDRSGVAVRAGTHCAEPLLARYGQTSTCRASFAVYNTTDEIDALVEALIKAQSFLA